MSKVLTPSLATVFALSAALLASGQTEPIPARESKGIATLNETSLRADLAYIASDKLSGRMSLQPGDVISTGTPPGVGLGQKPPVYLRADNVITLGIDGLGEQRQRVVSYKA